MSSHFFNAAKLTLLLAATCLISCSGAKGKPEADPMELLSKGRFREARATVQKKGAKSPTDRAIIALSLVAENPTKERAQESVTALGTGVDEIETAAAALELLDLVFVIPGPVEYEVSLLAVEVALGSVGKGPLTPTTAPNIPIGAASKRLQVSALERTHFALIGTELYIDSPRLLAIWNACFSLSGGSFTAPDDVQAWRLFHSIGGLAVTMSKAAPDTDLAKVLSGAAVAVLESNQSIAIAARCDIGSPFDGLKSALAYDRELSFRLEKSVASAKGCSRGTYAPETR